MGRVKDRICQKTLFNNNKNICEEIMTHTNENNRLIEIIPEAIQTMDEGRLSSLPACAYMKHICWNLLLWDSSLYRRLRHQPHRSGHLLDP